METGEARVKALYVYPVKSCRGISVSNASVTETGLKWDRHWMITNANGRFQTQRNIPKLALIEVTMPVEALDSSWGPLSPDAALCITAPGMEPLYVPLVPSFPLEKVEKVTCWEWSGPALSEGADADEWFSNYVGKPTRLVRFDTGNATRPTDPDYAIGYNVSFTDGYPFLLISQASLDALNAQLAEALPINRFRPSIFVEGCDAFAEDTWDTFTIGKLKFHGVKLCARCKVTTTNQQTTVVGKEPLQTLKTFRAGQLLTNIHGMKNQVYFGQNVACEVPEPSNYGGVPALKVGDLLKVTKTASVTEIML